MQRRYYGGATEVLRRCNGVIRSAGGRLWLIVDVFSRYLDGRNRRKCESRGGFRSFAEDQNAEAGADDLIPRGIRG